MAKKKTSKKAAVTLPAELIEKKVLLIRGKKVMLDSHLAELYGVETKVLNQAVRRNRKRFPEDFMLELTAEEYDVLRSQFVTLKGKGGRGQHKNTYPMPLRNKVLRCFPVSYEVTARLK